MKKNVFFICFIISISVIGAFSCNKKEENKPLKETQIYGSENHLPTRKLLSFLPQPDALSLVSPSLESIINSFFKIDNFLNNGISDNLKNNPTINLLIKENKEKTIENIKSLGIDIKQPFAFFYTLNDKWEAVLVGNKTDMLQKFFPDAKKTTLKTSWFWFISGKLSAYWDNKSNFGFISHNDYTFLSNDIELLTKSISKNSPPPSFYYGLDGKPIVSSDEIAIILSISDELKKVINNPKKTFEPTWLKTLLLALDTEYNEVSTIINPEENFHEIVVAVHPRQNPIHNNSLTGLELSHFIPENTLINFNLAITNGLKNFLAQLSRQDSSGEIKKNLNRVIGFINSPLFQDELSIGVLPPTGEDIPNIVVMTKSNQIQTLKSFIDIAGEPDEPVGDFEVLKADLEKLIQFPLALYIGFKVPYVVVTNNREQLIKVAEKITLSSQQEGNQSIQSLCPYGFIVNNTNGINTFFNNNPDLLKVETVETLFRILSNIPDMCMYNNESWYLLKVKLTI